MLFLRHLVVGEWEAGEGGREEARGRVSQWFTEEVGTAWTGVTAGSGGRGQTQEVLSR